MGVSSRDSGLFASLRGLFSTGLGLLQTRLELIATELEEEKLRFLGLLGYGAAAFLLLGAGIIFLAIFLTVLFWDTNRLLVLGGCTAAFLICGGIALLMAWRCAHAKTRLFATSLAELAEDRATLAGQETGDYP